MSAVRSWSRRHPLAVDGIVAAFAFTLGVLSTRIAYDLRTPPAHHFRFGTGIAFTALLTLPLIVRRRYPPVTLACVTGAVLGYAVFNVTQQATVATVAFVSIYSVGAYCGPRMANWTRGVCLTALFGTLGWLLLFRQLDLGHTKASVIEAAVLGLGSTFFFFLAAWVIGDVARAARLRAIELNVINHELEAAHEVLDERAVLAERVRIAREVHDVVAHHVSVMGVQAGAARRVMTRSPEQAAEVLTGIEASSRQAVLELHQLLGFLRNDNGKDNGKEYGEETVSTATPPQPKLSGLEAMIETMNEAGLRVTLRNEGTPGPLPVSVDLSAYRIVQEALTNALKHGGAGTIATATLTYGPETFQVEVVDDGKGRSNGRTDVQSDHPVAVAGHGLIGMRERVALHGGRFSAERGRGSGFMVRATFPLSVDYRTAS